MNGDYKSLNRAVQKMEKDLLNFDLQASQSSMGDFKTLAESMITNATRDWKKAFDIPVHELVAASGSCDGLPASR